MSTVAQAHRPIFSGTWSADPVHSTVAFAIDYVAGTFRGTFSRFEARVAGGALDGSAEVSSIQVKDANLEAHLQSPAFFDADRHPELSIRSREVDLDGDGLRISGELTMRGHTEPVTIVGRSSEPIEDPFGNVRIGLQLEAVVDRRAFGLDWNNALPSGESALGNTVTITADLQLVQES